MNCTLSTLVDDPQQAERLVRKLNYSGIPTNEISLLCKNRKENNELASELNTEAPSGKLVGASIGAALGWLAGLGTLMIPGIGLFIVAGPALSLLGGMTIGAAVGNLKGALIEMGIAQKDVATVLEGLEQDQVLIVVTLTDDDKFTEVWSLIADCGAKEIYVNHHGVYNN